MTDKRRFFNILAIACTVIWLVLGLCELNDRFSPAFHRAMDAIDQFGYDMDERIRAWAAEREEVEEQPACNPRYPNPHRLLGAVEAMRDWSYDDVMNRTESHIRASMPTNVDMDCDGRPDDVFMTGSLNYWRQASDNSLYTVFNIKATLQDGTTQTLGWVRLTERQEQDERLVWIVAETYDGMNIRGVSRNLLYDMHSPERSTQDHLFRSIRPMR